MTAVLQAIQCIVAAIPSRQLPPALCLPCPACLPAYPHLLASPHPARLLQVLLHVANPELRAQLETLQAADNGSDPLRYAFIVSQAQLVDSPAAATDGAAYSATAALEEGGIEVVVGVARADGHKCNRCWNYRCAGLAVQWGSVAVGSSSLSVMTAGTQHGRRLGASRACMMC